jgi:4-aminobutyrate aminotransferase-like enzyme
MNDRFDTSTKRHGAQASHHLPPGTVADCSRLDPTLQKILAVTPEEIRDWSECLMLGGGTPGGPVLHHGRGVYVWDVHGRRYIDCTAQSWALCVGHCNEELWEAINQQARYLTHVHQGFDTLPRSYLAKLLTDLAPAPLSRVSFSPSSGLAVEAAMKLALKNRPGSSQFVTLWDGYHGTTLGTMGLSWVATRSSGSYVGGSRFLPLEHSSVRAPNPYCYRCHFGQKPDTCDLACAQMLELTLEKGVSGPAAGVIIEPLQASGGMIPCPRRYLARVREICTAHEVPLIFDEIQTYIRIGRFFAAEYYGVAPDLIALGKALGGGLPLGATLAADHLEGFQRDGEELHTFACNTLSLVAAAKLIDIVRRDDLLGNANRIGAQLRDGLLQLRQQFPEIGDVRQVGLHVGVELVGDPETKTPLNSDTKRVRDEAMARGVIFGLAGGRPNVLKIKPPLITTENEAGDVLDVLEASFAAVFRR